MGLRFLWTVRCTASAVCWYLESRSRNARGRKGPLGSDTLEAAAVVSYCPSGCCRNVLGVFVSIGDKGGHSWDKFSQYLFSQLLKSSAALWHLGAEKLHVSVSLCLAWVGPEILSIYGKCEVLDIHLSLPVGLGSGAFFICKLAGSFTVPGLWAPAEPVFLQGYREDWTWTTEMYPRSVLFSWPKTKILSLTQGNC